MMLATLTATTFEAVAARHNEGSSDYEVAQKI